MNYKLQNRGGYVSIPMKLGLQYWLCPKFGALTPLEWRHLPINFIVHNSLIILDLVKSMFMVLPFIPLPHLYLKILC
jgi:hypothetical protein